MLRFILLGIIAFSGFYVWTVFPIHHGPGEITPNKPKLERVSWEKPFQFKDAKVIPLRKIIGEVRVIEKKRYFFDNKRHYSPADVLVGWKALSDERNLDHIHFSLDDRYFEYEFIKPPLPVKEILSQIDLWHLVPSNEVVDTQIKKLRKGSVISVEGYIIDLEPETKYAWRSELISPKNQNFKNTIIWITELKVK
tara:strand:- start:847 stop:1431 length:585 start_codon:yes stop_codon:yes gene_type:complete